MGDEFVSDSTDRDDEYSMEKGKAKCVQTELLPGEHPSVQPVREVTENVCRYLFKAEKDAILLFMLVFSDLISDLYVVPL